MSSAAFPVNDLLRRRLQTALAVATLTFCVASTMFLLLFGSRFTGLEVNASILTMGINTIFTQFISFIGALIFAVAVVLTSFVAYLMMAQRTRDFGLIKAAGCPNSLAAGYFLTELLATTIAGCGLGVIIGFLMDFGVENYVFSSYQAPNLLLIPLVFVVFFVLSLIFGLWPLLKASRMSSIKAISPVAYHGLSASASKHRPFSKSGMTWSIVGRSLLRRQSATFRLVLLFSIVFILLTVCFAGGIIASDTSTAWVRNSIGKNTVAIGTNDMVNQYTQLLSKFTTQSKTSNFDYSNANLSIPNDIIAQVKALPSVNQVDARLILSGQIQEVANFSFTDTGDMAYLGGNRTTNSLVVGIEPSDASGMWSVEGRFLSASDDYQAVVGDSIAQTIYSTDSKLGISQANPLVEDVTFRNTEFNIVGVCVDPLNNGFVTYVPMKTLENTTALTSPNLLLVTFKGSSDPLVAVAKIRSFLQTEDPNLTVVPLTDTVQKDAGFLDSNWQTIMVMPLFALVAAALSMVSYMMLAVDEQRQEFGILRAVGAKPRFVVSVLAIQCIVMLLSSFGIGISVGTILTMIILMPQPIVTVFTIAEISAVLFAGLAGILLLSVYPAFRLARASILKIIG